MLIDTGSQATLVSHSLVKDLRLINKIQRTKFTLSAFTKDKIRTLGELPLSLEIAGLEVKHTCIIVEEDMEQDILMGMDFMSRHNVSIHAGKGYIATPWGTSDFLSKPEPIKSPTKVRCASTVTVPPQTVMFIRGKLAGQLRDNDDRVYSGYLEPYENLTLQNSVLPASAMMWSEKGEVPLRIMNPTDEPVTIYKRKLVGFMKPIPVKSELNGVKVHRITDDGLHSTAKNIKDFTPGTEWTSQRLFDELKVDEIKISDSDKGRLKDILWNHRKCFSTHEFDLGTCNFFTAEINLKPDAQPQYVPPISVPYKRRDAMNQHLEGMERAGIIEETNDHSLWNSRVFLVPKPHQPGQFRFVADFRALNGQCLPDKYTIPNINHVADRIGGAKYYSTFDLSKSFFQVNYDEKSSKLTAFTANDRRYIFKRMVMGHLSSSQQFSRMVDCLLESIPLDQICYFLDDLMLASLDVTSHLDRLELLLDKLQHADLKLMPKKCVLLRESVQFVGWTISEQGISINNERVKAILELPPPRTIKEAQRLMGFLSYNRRFVKGFAGLAKPIYDLIDRKKKFQWTNKCNQNLDEIERRIAEGIILTIPNIDDPDQSYTVTIDASLDGYGAELSQKQGEDMKIIAYFSKKVPEHKRVWSQTKLEFECLVETLLHFSMYLRGTNFLVKTDCLSLLSLERLFAKANATMIRRLNKIADYQFRIQHLQGSANETSDFLSRYTHKKRVSHNATQTESVELRTAIVNLLENSHSSTTQTDLVESSVTDENVREDSDLSTTQTDLVESDLIEDNVHEESDFSTTQTDLVESSVTDENVREDSDSPTAQTDLVESSLNDENPPDDLLIPKSFYEIDDSSQMLTDKDEGNATPAELLVKSVNLTSHCTCELDIPDNQKEQEKTRVKINAIATTMAQQLHMPEQLDLETVKKAQEEDLVLQEVRKWVENEQKPKDLQKLRLPPELLHHWRQFKLICLRGGILCRKWLSSYDRNTKEMEIDRYLVLVPELLREQVLKRHHDSLVAIHPGIENTYNLILQRYYWPKLKEEVDVYVKSCVKCGTAKQPVKYLRAPLKHVIAHTFNQVLVIDHIVPQLEGMTPRGNRYILTMTDLFTGYIVAVPCRTKKE